MDLNDKSSILLMNSIASGDEDGVRFILDCGGNPDTPDRHGQKPLHMAVASGKTQIVRTLLNQGADVNGTNRFGWRPLHVAATLRRCDVINVLLERPEILTDIPDLHGRSALHRAVAADLYVNVRSLLTSGADVNIQDNYGKRPIHISAHHGNVHITGLLVAYFARCDVEDSHGQTPLHLAAESGDSDLVKLLVFHGAEVNKSNTAGETPLHVACRCGHSKIVQSLLNRGALLSLKDSSKRKPETVATSSGNDDVIRVIREHRRSLVMYASSSYAVKLDNHGTQIINAKDCNSINAEVVKDDKKKKVKDQLNKCKMM